MLLSRKRTDPNFAFNATDDLVEPEQAGPTIPMRAIPRPAMAQVNPLAQEPTIPIAQPNQSPVVAPAVDPTIALTRPRRALTDPAPTGMGDEAFGSRDRRTQPRDYVADDAAYLRDLENRPRNKKKEILEGLGQYAGSMIGLNVRGLIHPGGTETQKARRQLNTSIALQDQGLQQAQGQADLATKASTIPLHDAQTRKINEALANPGTSDADKADLKAIEESLRAFEGAQSSPGNDTSYAVLRERAKKYGIALPESYGKQAKGEKPEPDREVGGRMLRKQPDGSYKTVYEPPDKPEKPDETPAASAKRQREFRAAKKEFEDLIQQENEAARKKDAAYAKASTAAPGSVAADDANKAAAAAEEFYQTFGTKKTAAQARMLEHGDVDSTGNPVEPQGRPATGTYSGRTMSRANLAKYAEKQGVSLAAARAEVEGKGVKVQ